MKFQEKLNQLLSKDLNKSKSYFKSRYNSSSHYSNKLLSPMKLDSGDKQNIKPPNKSAYNINNINKENFYI